MRHREIKKLAHGHTKPGEYYIVRSVSYWRTTYQYLKNDCAFESYTL